MLASKTLGCAVAAPPDPAWDISNLVFLQSATLGASFTQDLFIKPDGLKLYNTRGFFGDGTVFELNLSTAWNITTASAFQSINVVTNSASVRGLFFKPDGTKMYTTSVASSSVVEYTLSTAWNVSTATYIQSFSVSSQDSTPSSLTFKPDGTKMFVLGRNNNRVYEYTLSTAWNISTASYVQFTGGGLEPEG